MAASIVLSGVVALTLTPVLCAMILRRQTHRGRGGLLGAINRRIGESAGKRAAILRASLSVLLGVGVAIGFYFALHNPFVHELVSEQVELTALRVYAMTAVVAVLATLSFRVSLSRTPRVGAGWDRLACSSTTLVAVWRRRVPGIRRGFTSRPTFCCELSRRKEPPWQAFRPAGSARIDSARG